MRIVGAQLKIFDINMQGNFIIKEFCLPNLGICEYVYIQAFAKFSGW